MNSSEIRKCADSMIGEIAAQLADSQFALRDRIAIEALTAYINCDKSGTTFWSTSNAMEDASTNAYAWADHLLKAREAVEKSRG